MTGEIGPAIAQLATLIDGDLTETLAALEHRLVSATGIDVDSRSADAGLRPGVLGAALQLRARVGRLNDVVHAAAILAALPGLLEHGETIVVRPSLAAGNDPSRPFDIETDRRVAEFKLAVWSASDADPARKRAVFQDLVHLAAYRGGKRAELHVAGPRPIAFLRTSRTTAQWALGRSSQSLRDLFIERFGSLDITVADFTNGPAGHVVLNDLSTLLPSVADALRG